MNFDQELAEVLKETGFEKCEFGPDDDECEACRKPKLQLYFHGPTDAGCYCCAECIVTEHRQNQADFWRAMNTEPAPAA